MLTSISKRKRPSPISMALLLAGSVYFILMDDINLPIIGRHRTRRLWLYTEDEHEHIDQMKLWRKSFEKHCQEPHAHRRHLQSRMHGMLEVMTTSPSETTSAVTSRTLRQEESNGDDEAELKLCRNVVLDLGRSIGQTVGQFVQAGIPSCEKHSIHGYYDMESGTVATAGNESDAPSPYSGIINPIVVDWFRTHLKEQPETYCYYGVESDASSANQLQMLQRRIRQTKPRPIRKLGFLLNTVIKTTSPLDNYSGNNETQSNYDVTINTDRNTTTSETTIPLILDMSTNGSSIDSVAPQGEEKTLVMTTEEPQLRSSQIVQSSSISITSLLHRTVKSSGHVVMKMDIIGGGDEEEIIGILEEANEVLCELSFLRTKIDIMIVKSTALSLLSQQNEEYNSEITTKKDGTILFRNNSSIPSKLQECGVNLYVTSLFDGAYLPSGPIKATSGDVLTKRRII